MEEFRTNQHYNYSIGLPIEYYDQYIQNKREENDSILIILSILFRGIVGSEDPYIKVVEFVEFVLENGEDLQPCIIEYYVSKFKSLPITLQDYALSETTTKNNYFREDSGSDKIALIANTEEYRTRSSSIPSQDQDPEINISENIKNKISPVIFKETIALSKLLETMSKNSNGTSISNNTYNKISKSAHNNYRTVTPTTTHLEAAILAKQDIEANSYKTFDDCYRVKREYKFKTNPYNSAHRQDNVSEYYIDNNKDIVGNGKSAIYTTAGNAPLSGSQRVRDMYNIMTLSRDELKSYSKTDKEENNPISGEVGSETSKLNNSAGKEPTKTYSSTKYK